MNKIYTVFGESGEYSDWRMWAVRAFAEKADADKFCEKLNEITSIRSRDNQQKALIEAGDSKSEVWYEPIKFEVQEIDFGLPIEAKP